MMDFSGQLEPRALESTKHSSADAPSRPEHGLVSAVAHISPRMASIFSCKRGLSCEDPSNIFLDFSLYTVPSDFLV